MSIEEKVMNLISEELRIPREKIKLTSHVVDDLNFDSLDNIQIVLEVEQLFDIEILDEEIDDILTVQDIVDYVKNYA